MISEIQQNTGGGSLSADIQPDAAVMSVVSFIKSNFSEFSVKHKQSGALNEKGLNQKLCIFLNMKLGAEPYFFHHEFMENPDNGNSPQVDIGTVSKEGLLTVVDREYKEGDSFFSIEAKRLPTEGAGREKEYVLGTDKPSGAMERFKKCIHGSRLKYAAIIGYIQNEGFEYWYLKINSWISELAAYGSVSVWENGDLLISVSNFTESGDYAELISDNTRTNGVGKIRLYHFWINLVG